MNNPFDQQPPEVPVVNIMEKMQESVSQYQQQAQSAVEANYGAESAVPGVASGNSKKKILLLAVLVGVLLIGGLAFFLLSSDSSELPAPELSQPVPPVAPVAPIAPPADATAPLAPVVPAPTSDAALPTGPLQDALPAAAVHPCEQHMIDYANQNGADAKAYVEQNQAYLAECKKAMEAGAK